MNWRTTSWLAGTALALALFIVAVERPLRLARSRTAADQRVLPGFDPAGVTALEVRSPAGTLALSNTNGTWELVRPERRTARQDRMEALLQRLATLRGASVLSPAELRSRPGAPADFGLNPPAAALTLSGRAGTTEILLGTRTLDGAQVYYQVTGVAGVFLADASLAQQVALTADGWRDTALLPLSQLAFDRLRVAAEGAAFTLARAATNRLWEMVEPRPARADSARVDVLLRQLGFVQIQRFFAPTSAPTPEVAGLRPPRLTVTLARGTNDVFTLALGAPVTNTAALDEPPGRPGPGPRPPAVYAQRRGDPEILAVPGEALDLLRISYKDLLDSRLLRFDAARLAEIEFVGPEEFRVVQQTNAWRILPADLPADGVLVQRLLAQLASLEMIDIAKEVVTDLDLASYGLAPPVRRISLRASAGDTNSVVAQLETGTLRNNRIFARVPAEQPVYLVSPADLDAIPAGAWQLRDRTVWRFASPQVAAITVRHDGLDWTVRRQGTNDWATPPGWRNDINPFALEEALHQLGSARALAWVDTGGPRAPVFGIGRGPEIVLDLRGQAATNQVRIAFGKRSPGGNRYAATALPDGSRPVFELPGSPCDELWNQLGITESPGGPP